MRDAHSDRAGVARPRYAPTAQEQARIDGLHALERAAMMAVDDAPRNPYEVLDILSLGPPRLEANPRLSRKRHGLGPTQGGEPLGTEWKSEPTRVLESLPLL